MPSPSSGTFTVSRMAPSAAGPSCAGPVPSSTRGRWLNSYPARATRLARRYSFSDRARYYINLPEVQAAIDRLFDNLTRYEIPMNMLHQYMPCQFEAVRAGEIEKTPRALALYGIMLFMRDYEYATR